MTDATVVAAPETDPEGGCGCDFTDRSDHDQLLGLETDPTVFAHVIRALTVFAEDECWPADRVPVWEIPTFLGQHTWSDPMWAYRLKGDLRYVKDALRPSRAARTELPTVGTGDVDGVVAAWAAAGGRLTARVERLEEHREVTWDNLGRRAAVLARTGLVPEACQGAPEVTMAALLTAEAYGLRETAATLQAFDFDADGRVTPESIERAVAAARTVAGRRRGEDVGMSVTERAVPDGPTLAVTRLTYSIAEVAHALGYSVSALCRHRVEDRIIFDDGAELRLIRLGRRMRVPAVELDRLLDPRE